MQRHRHRSWLNAQPDDPEEFQQQIEVACDCSQAAPPRLEVEGTHPGRVDEMTGIQARERIAATKPMRPGEVELVEFESQRNGTPCLIGNFEVATGTVVSPTVPKNRTEDDFTKQIERTVATDPEAGWIFVTDTLTIHCSERLVHFVAQACGITDDLGKKGRRGVLRSMATRKAFLTDCDHRIRFVSVPKHTS